MTVKRDLTEEDVKLIDSDLRKLHNDFMAEVMTPIQYIYIDLPLLIDYKLGTLLLIYQESKEAFDYIIKTITTDYNFLIGKHIASKFPQLGVSDGDVLAVLADPVNSKLIAQLSPITSAHDNVFIFLSDLYANNARFNTAKESKIIIHFNNPYFVTPDDFQHYIKTDLLKNVSVELHFIKDPTYAHPSIQKANYLFIDDISVFNRSDVVKTMFEQAYVDKTICAAYTSDLDDGRIDDKDVKQYFDTAEKYLNQKTDFKFIHKFIPYSK